jgi:GNAT superfamily N-acetyltransferase
MADLAQGVAFAPARLRFASLADVPRLVAFYRQARGQGSEASASLAEWLEHGGALLLEHAEAGEVVCALRWREVPDGWRLDPIATLPAYRGQSFGRWLMTKVEALAIQRNVPALTLELAEATDELLAYYGRMGYRPVSPEQPHVLKKRVGGVWQVKNGGGWP